MKHSNTLHALTGDSAKHCANVLDANMLRKAITYLKSAKPITHMNEQIAWIPSRVRGDIDREKYRGKGRPRKSDYHYKSMRDILNEVS